ncbi:MAG: hypothetical protein ACRD2T_10975 [Thermoanaerobaculia bacterium]
MAAAGHLDAEAVEVGDGELDRAAVEGGAVDRQVRTLHDEHAGRARVHLHL